MRTFAGEIVPKLTRVKHVMTPFPYTVSWEATAAQAVDMMETHGIRHLPVTRDEVVVGIVSDADLRVCQAMRRRAAAAPSVPVGLICTRDPYLVDLERPVVEAAEALVRRQIGSAIVTREGKLCGILSTTDLLELLASHLRRNEPPPPDMTG